MQNKWQHTKETEKEEVIWINDYPSLIHKREFQYKNASNLLVFDHAI